MTDNGLAALAERLERADFLSPNGYPTAASFATAILRNGAVFLPDGLGPVMVGMAKEIAALRAALGLLVGDIRDVGPDEPPQRMIPAQHRVSDIGRARAVLAIINPEETP